MRFKPIDENSSARQFTLLPPGTYDYQVTHAEEKVSQAGNEYIFIKLMVYDENGRERFIFTNLAFMKLVKTFCTSHSMYEEKYKKGELFADDCVGRIGKCVIGIEKGREKPDGGNYPDRNVVLEYLVNENPEKPVANVVDLNDDLPDFLM